MKCKSCGAESGKYPLCRECYKKERAGAGFRAGQGQEEHHSGESRKFLYKLKYSLNRDGEEISGLHQVCAARRVSGAASGESGVLYCENRRSQISE